MPGRKKWKNAWHAWLFSPKWPFLMPPRRSENLRRFIFHLFFLVFFSPFIIVYCCYLHLTLLLLQTFCDVLFELLAADHSKSLENERFKLVRLNKWLEMWLNQPGDAEAAVALPDFQVRLSVRSIATDKSAAGLLLLFRNTLHRLAFGSRTPETATNASVKL